MKKLLLILFLCPLLSFGQNSDSTKRVQDAVEKVKETEEKVDKNAKALTLLTVGISSLAAVIVALWIYIVKQQSVIVGLTGKCTEAMVKMSATNDKLAVSIDNSGDKISTAFSENKSTLAMLLTDNRRAIDELKGVIMSKA